MFANVANVCKVKFARIANMVNATFAHRYKHEFSMYLPHWQTWVNPTFRVVYYNKYQCMGICSTLNPSNPYQRSCLLKKSIDMEIVSSPQKI